MFDGNRTEGRCLLPIAALKELPALEVLEALPVPVLAIRQDGSILFANGVFAEMLDHTLDTLLLLTVTFLGARPGPWSGVSPSRLSPRGARRLSATAVTVWATTESPGEIPRSRHRPASGKVTNEAAGIAGVAPTRDRVGRRERKSPRPTAVP
jgi:hypothetical protein